jgi:hypothetical protein
MLPLAVRPSAYVLGCGYDLPAARTDLARRVRLVAFRVQAVGLKVLAGTVIELAFELTPAAIG